MESEKGRRQGEEQGADKKPHLVAEQSASDTGRAPKKEASISEKAFVDRIKKSDRWMIGLAFAIALSGILSAVIFWRQFNTMQAQLDEMRAERRPWVYATLKGLAVPITRDANGFRISLRFNVKNAGHLPAMGVTPISKATPGAPVHVMAKLASVEHKLCNGPFDTLGTTIFPGEARPMAVTTYLSKEDFDAWEKRQGASQVSYITPHVLVCFSYVDSGERRHSTPYYLGLLVHSGGGPFTALPTDSEVLARSHVTVIEEPDAGMPPD